MAMTLTYIQQDEDKSLLDFMERFSSITVRIRDLSPEVTFTSMIMALKSGPFSDKSMHKIAYTIGQIES